MAHAPDPLAERQESSGSFCSFACGHIQPCGMPVALEIIVVLCRAYKDGGLRVEGSSKSLYNDLRLAVTIALYGDQDKQQELLNKLVSCHPYISFPDAFESSVHRILPMLDGSLKKGWQRTSLSRYSRARGSLAVRTIAALGILDLSTLHVPSKLPVPFRK